MYIEIFLYALDIVIFVMFANMLKNSSEVELEVKVKAKWMIVAIFGALALLGFTRYEGIFRYIQTAIIIVLAIMYYNMKSGLSPKGIVLMGSLVTYEKAGTVSLSRENHCLTYKQKGMDAALFFDYNQYDDMKSYLQKRSVDISTYNN